MFLVFYFSYINLDVIWHKIQILCQIFYFILFYFIFFILFYLLFYFILFYFILFYFILFYFILFYFILFYFILFYLCPVFHTLKDHTRQSWIKEFLYLETLFHWAVSYILQSLVTEANFDVFPICTFTTKTC